MKINRYRKIIISIIILMIVLFFAGNSLFKRIKKISSEGSITNFVYYLATKEMKTSLSIFVRLYPNNINDSLKLAINKYDSKAIDILLNFIQEPTLRGNDGANVIGLLSTLIMVQKKADDNYYNLDQNVSLSSSDVIKSIGENYLAQFKINNKNENFLEKIQESNLLIKTARLIKIPGISKPTYNPSIITFEDGYLLSFRIDNLKKFHDLRSRSHYYTSEIGIIKLNRNFEPIGNYQVISDYINGCPDRCSAEDARLISLENKIYIIYNRGETIASNDIQRTRKMYLSQIEFSNNKFKIVKTVALISPYQFLNVERNWVPFIKNNELYLIYSIEPNLVILKPNLETGISEKIQDNYFDSKYPFGQLKGGTPLIEISDNQYFGIFHSNISNSEKRLYFLTPAVFSRKDDSFFFSSILSYPIFMDLYSFPHELLVTLLFPTGIVDAGDDLILTAGKNDGEIMLIKFDKSKILKELKNYNSF